VKTKRTVIYRDEQWWEIDRKPVAAFDYEMGSKLRHKIDGRIIWVRAGSGVYVLGEERV